MITFFEGYSPSERGCASTSIPVTVLTVVCACVFAAQNFWSRGFRQDIGWLPALPVYLVEKWQGGNRVFLLAEESFHFGYDIRMFFLCHNILDENHRVLALMIQFGCLLAAVDLMQNKVFLVESLFLNQILLHFQRNVLLNRFGLLRLCVFLLLKTAQCFI